MTASARKPAGAAGYDAGRILVVDDEPSMQRLLRLTLEDEGYEVATTDDGNEAVRLYTDGTWDLVIQDLRMPKMPGIELLRRLKEADPKAMIIVVTAFSTWDNAVEAMRLGAYDYLKKPFDTEALRAVVRRALERRELFARLAGSPRAEAVYPESLAGSSAAMREVLDLVRRVAPTDSTVLIQGESGSGKELIARAIHHASARSEEAFIPVNCGAFTETLLESELFGHVRGSFTGAVADKRGLFEIANRGTLFLDEVAEMTLAMQVKLLRVLETREVRPVGSERSRNVDVRIIAATNRDLMVVIGEGKFREDLFYRLNVIPLAIPPLRQRREDIPLLAGQFLARVAGRTGRSVVGIDEAAMKALVEYEWPGNVRELENAIERAMTLTRGEVIGMQDLVSGSLRVGPAGAARLGEGGTARQPLIPPEGISLPQRVEEYEGALIGEALRQTDGNLTAAAKLLGLTFRAIRYKVKKYGIRRRGADVSS